MFVLPGQVVKRLLQTGDRRPDAQFGAQLGDSPRIARRQRQRVAVAVDNYRRVHRDPHHRLGGGHVDGRCLQLGANGLGQTGFRIIGCGEYAVQRPKLGEKFGRGLLAHARDAG